MGDFQLAADSYPIWKAILWCFYPVGSLVAIELFSRSIMDKEHPYWRWAELINGRMAMIGIVAMVLSKLLTNHLFFGLYY